MTLEAGKAAPAFSLQTGDGTAVSLKQFRGKTVVLYFYPKDDTPGCTKEACSFRDSQADIKRAGAVVLGISGDDEASHKKFSEKYHLTFPLLADPGWSTAKAYGVYKQKSMYGKTFWGIERTTFIIDASGRIAKIFPRVKVDGHVDEVLAALQSLDSAQSISAA